MDYFESVANYEGKLANIVLTKDGPLQFIQQQPFLDTLFYHSDGTNGYEYFSIRNIEGFLLALDSLQIDTTLVFTNSFRHYRIGTLFTDLLHQSIRNISLHQLTRLSTSTRSLIHSDSDM
jgi:hypothetical protein